MFKFYFGVLPLFLLTAACTGDKESKNTTTNKETDTASQISATPDSKPNKEFPYSFEQVADKIHVIHGPLEYPNVANKGFMNNPAIVETSAGLVVIDPGSTIHVGEFVLSEIRKVSDQPVVAVFNTHVHGDHWLGNQAIKAAYPDVKIYGHPKMIEAVANGEGDYWVDMMHNLTEGASDGTTVVAPDNEVDNESEILIGDTHFRIHHYGLAHTKTDIMIEAVEPGVVFLGDNVLNKRIPRTSDGTFMGNINTISSLLNNTEATLFIPGHGPTSDRAMVENYRQYLQLIYDAAYQAFSEDLDSSEVIDITRETTAAYQNWSGYEDQLGPHGAQAYAEVEAVEF